MRAGSRHRPRPQAVGLLVVGLTLALVGGGCARQAVSTAGLPSEAPAAMTTVPIPSGDFGLPSGTARLGQRVTRVDPPVAAPPLVMPDTAGGVFDLASLRGAPALVYFGYTRCPDVCPTTLGVLREVAKERPDVRVVFVTVDPERDTAGALGEYLSYFHQGWIGLSGDAAQTRSAADAWGVRYARVDSGSASGYLMAHSAEVYLVDAAGDLRYRYPFGTQDEEIVHDLTALTE